MSLIHLGVIADGNRRWAKERGLPSIEGHRQGLKSIEKLVNGAMDAGIQYITFYVFSTENWGRSEKEVSYILKLAETKILGYAEKMKARNGRMVILGSKGRIPPKLLTIIEKAEKITEDCDGITVGFCFNYGGELEIADAANVALEAEGKITPETIRKHLYHPEIPDIDMVVRTSGEERISGFMLWRSSYAEFMFIKKYFPEMDEDDIKTILKEYDKRNRRFGK
ncbi:di-trans,poly-cis-decaprenylcistransferase [Candidatus Saccharibacteria bacterium]|nr:di-trans,poly-cis-decaprenylcistransferase [Candidatus Saccharibacteria bacterium]